MNIAAKFYENAGLNPDAPCLLWEGPDQTYGQILEAAERLRLALPEHPRIGLLASRSPVAYAGLIAILAKGAAYVPLHPMSGPEQWSRMLQLAGVQCILVGPECKAAALRLLHHHPHALEIVLLDGTDGLGNDAHTGAGHRLTVSPLHPGPISDPSPPKEGLAYILFTSGSTGVPKGVMVRHSNIARYVDSVQGMYPVTASDRMTQLPDLTFDLSVHDLFVAWNVGASLVCFPSRALLNPLGFAKEKGVTAWCSGPSVGSMLESCGIAIDNVLPEVRLAVFCGEKFTRNAYRAWKRIAPNSVCANLYGPTEATVAITGYTIPDDLGEEDCFQEGISIGTAFPDQIAQVRRDDGTVCSPGEKGILWLGGDQVTAGYLDPKMTSESFARQQDMDWYCTGDLAFVAPSGNLFFVGRKDFQVKVMGVRIELGEVEAALMRLTGASFAVADVAPFRGSGDELFCTLPTEFASRKREIREALRTQLEYFMIPRLWLFLDELPRNANGKTDRSALRTLVMDSKSRENAA